MNFFRLLHFINLKHIRHHRVQTIMAGAGVCLGVMAIVSIGVVNQSVIRSFADSFQEVTGKAVWQVLGPQSGFPESIVDMVRTVSGVECAVPVVESEGLLVAGKEKSVFIIGVDVLVDTLMRDYSLSGETADIPDPLLFLARPDSILITETMSLREGISLDQVIELQTVQGIRPFRVRGILNPTGLARVMGGNVIVMDIYAAQMAFGKEGRIDRIDVRPFQGEAMERVRERILKVLPGGFEVDTPPGRTRQVRAMISKFQDAFNIIGFLALFAGMYLIYNAVSISVTQRRKEIGILRAIGTSRRLITLLFMGETLIISTIASVWGVALGLGLADRLVGSYGRIVSETYARVVVTGIDLSWNYPLLGLASGIFAGLVAAYLPARRGGRIQPISAIRFIPFGLQGPTSFTRMHLAGTLCLAISLAALLSIQPISAVEPLFGNTALMMTAQFFILLGLSLFIPSLLKAGVAVFHRGFCNILGGVGTLAILNLGKSVRRNAAAVAAVFFGISIYVGSAGLIFSVRESVIHWVETVNRADIIVTSGHPMSSANAPAVLMPAVMAGKIESLPGVLSVDPWRRIGLTYKGKPILLSSVDFTRRAQYSTFPGVPESGQEERLKLLTRGDHVVVSEAFSAIFDVKEGDRVSLATPRGEVSFRVLAIVVDYTSDLGIVLIDYGTFQRLWEDSLVNAFSVRIKEGGNVAEVCERIRERFVNDHRLFVLPALAYKNEIRKVLDGMFLFNHALNIITLTIACFGIIVAQSSSVLERSREIRMLRSIGMLRRQVAGVVILESIFMGVAGGVLGVVCGIISGWIELEGLFSANYGSAAGYFIPYGAIIWALVLSAGLSSAAGVIPAWQASKTNISGVVGHE